MILSLDMTGFSLYLSMGQPFFMSTLYRVLTHSPIFPNCETTESIIHISDTFHVSVNTEGKLVPLCQLHYKQVSSMIGLQNTCMGNVSHEMQT